MVSKAATPDDYVQEVSEDKKEAVIRLRDTVLKNLPEGFKEQMSYGSIGYVVPHAIFPAGYHCDPKVPLPFMNIAAQKNFVAFYHMGIYASPELLKWFSAEYPKHVKSKLDMGKSCVRFKKVNDIPYELIGELVKKISVKDWITLYQENLQQK